MLDGRDEAALTGHVSRLAVPDAVTVVRGDVADPVHRREVAAAVTGRAGSMGGLDLLVSNASELGPSPQPELADYPLGDLERVYEVNVFAPLSLCQLLLPHLRRAGGRIVHVSSDAAVEPYPGWGGYGSSKAALDQLTAVLGAENPDLRVYAFDPGDMATAMQQRAFPGEDISDRPAPNSVIPALLRLIGGDYPSGRYRGVDLAESTVGTPA